MTAKEPRGLWGWLRGWRRNARRLLRLQENLRPLADRILFQRDQTEEISAGGIHKPDTGKKKSLVGTVLAIGSAVKEVKVGDRIRFGVYSGFEIDDVGERWGITKEDEVWGVIDP